MEPTRPAGRTRWTALPRLAQLIAVSLAAITACGVPDAPSPDASTISSAVTASAPPPVTTATTPQLVVERADASGFRVRFRPRVRESQVTLNHKLYDSLASSGAALSSQSGAPAVPYFARPYAVPDGAVASVNVVSVTTHSRTNRWLRPTPPRWSDTPAAAELPVTESPIHYAATGPLYPAAWASVRNHDARLAGLRTGMLQLSTARFSPAARTLEIVDEMVVDVTFDRAFATRPAVRGVADRAFADNFINQAMIDSQVNLPPILTSPELLIITHDTVRAAAQRLAVWKEQKGIDTWVVSTSAIGSTASAIKTYIQSVYNAPISRLRYLLLFGDVELVPSNYVTREVDGDPVPGEMASDMPYAQLDSNDSHADVAYGRISVDTLAEANTVVDKSLDYEQTPSFLVATYDNLTFSGYFQEDSAKATLNVGGVLVTSDALGGNDISLEIAPPLWIAVLQHYAFNWPQSVTVSGKAITVTLGTDAGGAVSTSWLAVKNAINGNAAAAALVTASEELDPDDDGTNQFNLAWMATPRARQNLSGGKVHDGQEDRPYISVLEEIRDVMIGNGKTVERLYTSNSTSTPARFNDGTALPADLGPASGFAWDATATDIQASFNAGRSIIWHRDHGSRDGWYKPSFSITNLSGLSNGNIDPASAYEDRYPVVFNINCASGTFDQETDSTPPSTPRESFAEELLRRSTGGAVAVVAASRASSTTYNQYLAQGLFDAYWGNVVVGFDRFDTGAPYQMRLGDALVYAKDWVLASASDPTDPYVVDQLQMYHLHGDPTLEVWTDRPISLGEVTTTWRENGTVLRVVFTSTAYSTPYVAMWQGTASSAAGVGRLVSSSNVGGAVTRTYDIGRPANNLAITLYVTQPGYRPMIRGVGLP